MISPSFHFLSKQVNSGVTDNSCRFIIRHERFDIRDRLRAERAIASVTAISGG